MVNPAELSLESLYFCVEEAYRIMAQPNRTVSLMFVIALELDNRSV